MFRLYSVLFIQPLDYYDIPLMKITVVGSLNYDLVTTVGTVPQGGETVQAIDFETHHGGKGANEALALSRLSKEHDIHLVGCVGNDVFGKELTGSLTSAGVNMHVQTVDESRTGTATILVEQSGENRIMVYAGANQHVTTERFPESEYFPSDFILLQNEIPLETTFSIISQSRNHKTATVFNPSPIPKTSFAEYPFSDYIVVNETEAEALTGVPVPSVEEAYKALPLLLKQCSCAVVTLGSKGVVWMKQGEEKPGFQPAISLGKVVDTTGAGDTFLAAMCSQLASGRSMSECMRFAAAASGIVVTRRGAASSIPEHDEVIAALK